MKLNISNIEEVIFQDKRIQALFPEFRIQFDQWMLGKRVPGLKSMSRRMLLEVLNSLDGHHLGKLEEYLSDIIILEKIDQNLVHEYQTSLEDTEDLCKFAGFQEFCVHRDERKLSVLFWR